MKNSYYQIRYRLKDGRYIVHRARTADNLCAEIKYGLSISPKNTVHIQVKKEKKNNE